MKTIQQLLLALTLTLSAVAQTAVNSAPVTTIATGLGGPIGMTFDAAGDLIVADLQLGAVMKISRDGTASAVASVPSAFMPRYDAAGNLLVSSFSGTNGQIIRIDPSGSATVVATGLTAPAGFIVEPAGTLLLAQAGGSGIVRLDPTGTVTPLNLPGGYDVAFTPAGDLLVSRFGLGTVTSYALPSLTETVVASGLSGVGGIAFDAAGNLYIAAQSAGKIVRVPVSGPAADFVTGLASPRGLAFDALGGLYVSNRGHGTIQRIGVDATAPVLTVPADVVVEATSPAGAVATFSVSALDDVPGIFGVDVSQASGTTFPLGTTVVEATATDPAGNTGSASFRVIVRDTTPPVITSLTPSITRLWPANHAMIDITVTAETSDAVGPVTTRIVRVQSSERPRCRGDHDHDDVEIVGPMAVRLRAERGGGDDDRTYTITVEATDGAGNSSSQSTTVVVPHSASSGPAKPEPKPAKPACQEASPKRG